MWEFWNYAALWGYSSVHLHFPRHMRLSVTYLAKTWEVLSYSFQCHRETSITEVPFFACWTCSLSGVSYCICHVSYGFFSLCSHLWICAASLPVRTKAHASRLWPRLGVSVHLAGLALTATCPTSRVKWQLHKEVNQHPLCSNWKHFPMHLLPPCTCGHPRELCL